MTRDTKSRRVLICEDSRAYASALSRFLGGDEEIEVVGIAASGEQAISDVARLHPDLLTLDMQLPGIDGLDVVRTLMDTNPLPIVILSAHVARGSERAAEALAAGALDVVSKDGLRLDHLDDVWARAMRSRLRRLSSIRVKRPSLVSEARPRRAATGRAHVARAVGVGASTGGPPVLEAVLGALRGEPRELEAIDWRALLSAAHARGEENVTVWVCACASGEEAYSVAMLAIESFGQDRAPVSILATDISDRALARAQDALYTDRSTREVDATRRERFFTEQGRKSAVGEQLRSMIRFRRHNLVADPAPPLGEVPFDLILCRNLLIYFGAANVEVVVKSLESALRPGGQLILGASDRLTSSARRFDLAARGQLTSRSGVSSPSKLRPQDATRARRKPIGRADRTVDRAAASPAARKRIVADAQAAANVGNYAEAIDISGEILALDPLDADAYFVRGLAELAARDPVSATESLRRALYIDPTFALAAFQLGRAQDLRGDARAALRAYRQALSTLDAGDERHLHLLEQVNPGDIAAACRARLVERRVGGLGFES